MKKTMLFACLFVFATAKVLFSQAQAPVPLYTDPNFKGSADPEIIWNGGTEEWWIFYTNRQSVCDGCPLPARSIGVAASKDWVHWEHKGYIKVDGIGGKPLGPNILWAPGITRNGNTYHMFLTFKKGNGNGSRWGTPESVILHMTAPADDLLNGWTTKNLMHMPFNSIDATLIKNDSIWTLYHRQMSRGEKGVNTYQATTNNIDAKAAKWNYSVAPGDVNEMSVNGYHYQEGPFAFYWKDNFWLLTDPSGPDVAAYTSKNLKDWKLNGVLFDGEGKGKWQKGIARHPGVVVLGDRAFVFYFNQPFRDQKNNPDREACYLQVSELFVKDGQLVADRDARVDIPKNLVPKNGEWGQKR